MAAVHRTIVLVDVAGFGDPRRTDSDRVAVREALYRLLVDVFDRCGAPWSDCDHEDRGDGVLILAPPSVPKSVFAGQLISKLVPALLLHNNRCDEATQIRLRLALHAGEIHYDGHGVAGQSVNLAFRLLEAPVLKRTLASSPGPLAVVVSAWFYEEVVRHSHDAAPDRYRRVRIRAKETDTAAWICLPDASLPADLDFSDDQVPRQLPTNARTFVGRSAELDRLTALLDGATPSGTVVITAIDGTAGIGKTTLALHWAHRVKQDFPDGQLHVNLRGFDPGEPMDPGEALFGFLQSLGVDARSIPADLDQRAALYRSLLADRRMLIVLDNARSSDHVRPLLPASPSCVVLVTSRRRLDGLVVREGAQRIALDVLSTEDCVALLSEREPRFADSPDVALEVASLCGRLPLALCIVAARAAGQSSLRWLVDELRDLDGLALGDADLNVRAVFSWSYNVLSPGAARLFRLLGLHPGPDISRAACAALVDNARESLAELVTAHLIAEYVPGRFRFHDLVRAYAAEVGREESAEVFLDHYLAMALAADRVIQPFRDGVVREPRADLTTYADGMDWFTAEIDVLLALIAFAAERGFTGYTWRLAWACTTFLRRSGRWQERVAVHRIALAVTSRGGDTEGQATALRHLAVALGRLGAHDDALDYLREALDVHTRTDCRAGQFKTHLAYNRVLQAIGKQAEALAHAERAVELGRDAPYPLAQADALNALGKQLAVMGRYPEALPLCEQALQEYLRVGIFEGQAGVLRSLGVVDQALGRLDCAVHNYRRSIDIDRLLGDRYWEARGCDHLGDAFRDAGDMEQAAQAWHRALLIFEELRHQDADRVRLKTS